MFRILLHYRPFFTRCQLKIILAFVVFSSPFWVQSQDLITLRNGKQIECTITKIDSTTIHYNFWKGDRELSSYIGTDKVKSYRKKTPDNFSGSVTDSLPAPQATMVVVDTSKYIKETQRWTNLITYSQRIGANAKGWSVQYYGYNFRSTTKWFIPLLFGVESFDIDPGYFDKSGYTYASMSYFNAGISPFYQLNEFFLMNLGAQLVFGDEELQDARGSESSHSFFGIAPSQGIYFISKTKVGITLGISVYEKLLSSKVYKSDVGLKLEMGIKF
jgi:hypothetical protein